MMDDIATILAPFAALHRHVGQAVRKLDSYGDPTVALLAALTSHWAVEQSSVCFDLERHAGRTVLLAHDQEGVAVPPLRTLQPFLHQSSAVGKPGDFRPLILDSKNRLYLHRFWSMEERLARGLRRRTAEVSLSVSDASPARKVPDEPAERALGIVANHRLCIVSGGPGTGKTTLISRVLNSLKDLHPAPPRIALAAPTGKAAARLSEAAASALTPIEAQTLHRLLGWNPDAGAFRFNPRNRLSVDAVIVDEAGMVDLFLMAGLLDALPEGARLILLGDKDQLHSVAVGSVFGDICDAARFSTSRVPEEATLPLFPTASARPSAIQGCYVELTTNYRFKKSSELYRLARAVNAGDADVALKLLQGGKEIAVHPLKDLNAVLDSFAARELSRAFAAKNPVDALSIYNSIRVLSPYRNGPVGVRRLNERIERALVRHGVIEQRRAGYSRKPLLILRNDYQLGLFNGDLGLLDRGEGEDSLHAFFGADHPPFPPGRLPENETAYATTVHKSQGSEFDLVLFVLPEEDSPLITRQLIYTAVTRSRGRLVLIGNPDILRRGIERPAMRSSGLLDRLGEPVPEEAATPA